MISSSSTRRLDYKTPAVVMTLKGNSTTVALQRMSPSPQDPELPYEYAMPDEIRGGKTVDVREEVAWCGFKWNGYLKPCFAD